MQINILSIKSDLLIYFKRNSLWEVLEYRTLDLETTQALGFDTFMPLTVTS